MLRVWGHLPLWWWRRRRKWFRSGYPINNKYTSFLLFPGLLNNESPSQEKIYLQKSIKKNLNKIFIFFVFYLPRCFLRGNCDADGRYGEGWVEPRGRIIRRIRPSELLLVPGREGGRGPEGCGLGGRAEAMAAVETLFNFKKTFRIPIKRFFM